LTFRISAATLAFFAFTCFCRVAVDMERRSGVRGQGLRHHSTHQVGPCVPNFVLKIVVNLLKLLPQPFTVTHIRFYGGNNPLCIVWLGVLSLVALE
jgi:hypothetical protein